MTICKVCKQEHISHTRPELPAFGPMGGWYCHGYRQPGEHYHESLRVLEACKWPAEAPTPVPEASQARKQAMHHAQAARQAHD